MPVTPFKMENVTIFAETNFRNQRKKFGIKRADRRRHMYVLGKTGMGKTSLIAHMIVQDIRAGEGLLVFDAAGALALQILQYVPESRVKDVVYFNPMDCEYPFAFNFLAGIDAKDIYEFADGIFPLFQELWADSWGPRFEYVFKNALLSLLQYGDATLLHLLPLLTDRAFRAEVIARLNDPVLIDFWEKEFAQFPDRFLETAVEPLQDKMGQIIANPILRNIIGQRYNSFRFKDLIDGKKIVILSLNKSEIGAHTIKLLGGVFVLRLLLEAHKSVKSERDFYVYLDDFNLIALDSFARFLSTSDYGINFIVSNQYLSQVPESMRETVMASIGTLASFRVGATDANFLAEEFGGAVSEEILTRLAPHSIIVRLMIDGAVSAPFSAIAFEPLARIGLKDRIVGYSRDQYANKRLEVERRIVESLRNIPASPVKQTEDDYLEKPRAASNAEQLEAFRKARLTAFGVRENILVKSEPLPQETRNAPELARPKDAAILSKQAVKRDKTNALNALSPGQEVNATD